MAEVERFGTRDVKNKEIYDSYMGILRISPNEIYGQDIDDPTQLLNTLFNDETGERTQITLSDSDGNVFSNIYFQPKAFETRTMNGISGLTTTTETLVDVINMTTVVEDVLHVANTLKSRSTILLERPKKDENNRWSNLRILSGGESSNSEKAINGDGWLLYPTESPNDDNYFNAKNKKGLFNVDDTSTPRYKQVEKSLLSKTRKWHEKEVSSEFIIIEGKHVTQINNYNEEVPILYTRDYILGHYDGHSSRTNVQNKFADAWGTSGTQTDDGKVENITKLSWTRIDDLIWDSLTEVLSGELRHVKGRYDELGTNEFVEPGLIEQLGFEGEKYKKFAPILGTEVARGTIMYHAMPFHRYWFHRTRQALRGFIERKKGSEKEIIYEDYENEGEGQPLDDFVINRGLNLDNSFEMNDENYNLIHEEIVKLQQFYENGLITPTSCGTVGFVNSLAKNFVICNGRNVTFANFPNLSLTNNELFETEHGIAIYSETSGFAHKTLTEGSILYAIKTSMGEGDFIKLPNLFALYENTPRLIRGQNWKHRNDTNTVTVYDETISNKTESDYVSSLDTNEDGVQVVDTSDTTIIKQFDKPDKPYFHTYDHLVDKETHKHHMFSSITGGRTDKWRNQLLGIYHCKNHRVNADSHCRRYDKHWLNYDVNWSQTTLFTKGSGWGHGWNHYYLHNVAYEFGWYGDPDRHMETGDDVNKNVYSYKRQLVYRKPLWIDYCFNAKVYKGKTYDGYTPIPNLGLFLFNTSIFNNEGLGSKSKFTNINPSWTNTTYTKKESDNNNLSTYYLKDPFTNYLYTEKDENKNDVKYGYRGTFSNDLYYYNYSKNADNGLVKINNAEHYYGYYDGEGNWHDTKPLTFSVTTADLKNATKEKLKQYDKEKQTRKFFATKMNEAEGFIPFSAQGNAGGYILIKWSRDERSGSNSSSRNTYQDVKNNCAGYRLAAPNIDEKNTVYWRCLTSTAYVNASKLGVGNITKYIENRTNYDEHTDYYDVNCVTQLPNHDKYKSYYYGGEKVIVDETCPTPSPMNLLPLIRI